MEITCPSCGHELSIDAGYAGATITCPNCGQGVEVPVAAAPQIGRAPRPSAPSPGPPGEGGGEGDFDHRTDIEIPNHPLPNPLPAYRARGPETSSPRYIVVALFIALVAAAAGYFLRGAGSSNNTNSGIDAEWEQSHRQEILKLKSDAEGRVIAGDLKGGHEKYRELQV